MDYSSVRFESGIHELKMLDYPEKSFLDQAVPDKETAIMIAEIIIKNEQKNGYFEDYVPQLVFFDEQEKLWIITFWRDDGSIGAECKVVIQQDDAKILGIWAY